MEFKARLKELRKEKGVTQEELSKLIGVSRPSITKYETGTREPEYEKLIRIANFFDCSIDYLLGRVDDKNSVATIVTATELNKLYKMTLSEYSKLLEFTKNAVKNLNDIVKPDKEK